MKKIKIKNKKTYIILGIILIIVNKLDKNNKNNNKKGLSENR